VSGTELTSLRRSLEVPKSTWFTDDDVEGWT
jgi:hypothetical protein